MELCPPHHPHVGKSYMAALSSWEIEQLWGPVFHRHVKVKNNLAAIDAAAVIESI